MGIIYADDIVIDKVAMIVCCQLVSVKETGGDSTQPAIFIITHQ